jgi:amylosucrase
LSDFYSGRFPNSFARGDTFQYNPKTGDRRISGSLASLAGLELALAGQDRRAIQQAVDRILLVHNLILAFGGVPLLYMGDELGLLNDLSYKDDPDLAADNRWLHRPFMNWELAERRHDPATITGQIFQGLRQLIAARQSTPALHAQAAVYAVWAHNDHLVAIMRDSPRGRLLIVGNVSEQPQTMPAYRLRELGFEGGLRDCLSGRTHDGWLDLTLAPYEARWLERVEDKFTAPTQKWK